MDHTSTARFPYETVHDVSISILETLEREQVEIPLGIMGTALTLGRLLAPGPVEREEESRFVVAALEWGWLFFAGGRAN